MRRLVLRLLHVTGATWLWRWWHRRAVTILMTHGVEVGARDHAWVPLRPQLRHQALEACLRALAPRYRFVSLDEAVAMLRGEIPVRPYSLALTFDDGYRNQLTQALPALRRWKAPATFFITTGHVEDRRPYWFDRLDFALQQLPVDGRKVRIGPEIIQLRAGDRDALRASYKALRDAAKAVPRSDHEMRAELEALAEALELESGRRLADVFEADAWSSVVSWADVTEHARATDISFGSHTVSHVRLAEADRTSAEAELRRSKAAIEAHTGTPCQYFCYPNGSVSAPVAALTAQCGYAAAVTVEPGLNRVGDDVMRLRRINLPEQGGDAEILAEVSGLADALRALVARLAGWREPRGSYE